MCIWPVRHSGAGRNLFILSEFGAKRDWVPTFVGVTRLELYFMDRTNRLKRIAFRAHHRGVREADLIVGGFFDTYHAGWDVPAMDWFEALLDEQDVDIMAWAMGAADVPERWQGVLMTALKRLDYVEIVR